MRKVLFRGKRVDNGEWVYWDALGMIVNIATGERDGTSRYIAQLPPVDPATIGQYIGRTDKNGNWIFEGDIVKNIRKSAWMGVEELVEQIIFCEWNSEHCAFVFSDNVPNPIDVCFGRPTLTFIDNDIKDIQVIGNIHDNPELVGGGA